MSNNYYVYIVANRKGGVIYTGVTNDLNRRIYEHKNKLVKGFTEKYNVNRLMYYEITNSIEAAIAREKQLKKWNRTWKTDLINKTNHKWLDLSESDFG